MNQQKRRAVWLLGACQCVFWGLLYYGFSVLLLPWQRSLNASQPAVAGAFSFGLLAMALAAPSVGRWIDQNHAGRVFRIGGVFAILGLVIAMTAHGLLALYLAWLCMGLAMAGLLYEPAFGLVTRAFADPHERLRALASVTVLGGLASTLCLPLMAWLVAGLGWRGALLVFTLLLFAACVVMERAVLPVLLPHGHIVKTHAVAVDNAPTPRRHPASGVTALFVSGTLASMALTTLLIPLLSERGISAASAATALAALGIMQLPGRLLILRSKNKPSMYSLLALPVALQAGGFILMLAAPSVLIATLGVAIYGLGAGLLTLSRPWLLQRLYGVSQAGRHNGLLARWQGLARASGPVGAAGLASFGGTSWVFSGVALMLLIIVPLAWRLASTAEALPLSSD